MNILDYLKIYPGAFPGRMIDEIRKMDNGYSTRVTTRSIESKNERVNDYRMTERLCLDTNHIKDLNDGLELFYNSYLKNTYKKEIKNIEDWQHLKYNEGYYYKVHNDSEDFIDGKLQQLLPRDITVIVYLNSDYEGGELTFPDYGITIKPTDGMVITFPSYYDFQHEVKPVTKGTRYNLVTWIETNERLYPR